MENVLKMPRSYVEVRDDEMEYVEGNGYNIFQRINDFIAGHIIIIASTLALNYGNYPGEEDVEKAVSAYQGGICYGKCLINSALTGNKKDCDGLCY